MTQLQEKIIDAAIHAPSGDNCQPWRFGLTENGLNLYLIPERDNSLYNYNQLASLVSHGAVIENITTAARHLGLQPSVEITAEPKRTRLVAKIIFTRSVIERQPLYEDIFLRCTNRKPYKKNALSDQQREYLLNPTQKTGAGRVALIENPEKIQLLAQTASRNEEILFSNFYLHKFFFDHVIWSTTEEIKRRVGFYAKTLEVPAPAMPAFKLARHWRVLKWLNHFGFSKMIAKANSQTYSACSGLGAVIVPKNDAQNFVLAGSLLQKVWLKSSHLKLSFQTLAGITCLFQKVSSGQTREFSAQQVEKIHKSYQQIQNLFGAQNETVVSVFRIGDGGQPSARTLRLPADIFQET